MHAQQQDNAKGQREGYKGRVLTHYMYIPVAAERKIAGVPWL